MFQIHISVCCCLVLVMDMLLLYLFVHVDLKQCESVFEQLQWTQKTNQCMCAAIAFAMTICNIWSAWVAFRDIIRFCCALCSIAPAQPAATHVCFT